MRLRARSLQDVPDWSGLRPWKKKTVHKVVNITEHQAFDLLDLRQEVLVSRHKQTFFPDDGPGFSREQIGNEQPVRSFQQLLNYAQDHSEFLTHTYIRREDFLLSEYLLFHDRRGGPRDILAESPLN